MEQKFTAQLEARGPNGAWTHMPIPFDVESVFGSKARVPVAGTLNGVPYRNSIMPRGDGTHYMNIRRELQDAAGVKAGDRVTVTMAVDKAERKAEVPDELKRALEENPAAWEYFADLSYSHQKEYVDWIASAKRAETQTARVAKAIEMLTAKKKAR